MNALYAARVQWNYVTGITEDYEKIPRTFGVFIHVCYFHNSICGNSPTFFLKNGVIFAYNESMV